jgi:hypothetical protein
LDDNGVIEEICWEFAIAGIVARCKDVCEDHRSVDYVTVVSVDKAKERMMWEQVEQKGGY